MIEELKEVRDTLDFLEDCLCNRVPREAAKEAITKLDQILNQDEVDMVEKAARAMSCSYRCSDDAKAALHALGLIGSK